MEKEAFMPSMKGVFRNPTLAGAARKWIAAIFAFLWKHKVVIIKIVFAIARLLSDRKDG
jgi:hypothetical protein